MNRKKLLIFLLCAFLPVVGIGIAIHCLGGIISYLLTVGAMLVPMLAVVITQLIFKEPVFSGMAVSFKINRWWFAGWILMPLVTMAIIGMSLLMPGAKWSPDSELVQMALQAMPEGLGVWGLIAISLVSGMFAGITLNAVFAFGEEIAWRGFLLKEFKGRNFLTVALITGLIWGLWHAPIILNGHNYPQHPVAGVFLMVIFCIMFTPMLMYFRQKSASVIVPAIMHGTFNGIAGLSLMVVNPANDLLYGATGLAGIIVLLLADICLYLYDRFISRENIFLAQIW